MKSNQGPKGFRQLGVSADLVHRLRTSNIVEPTPIQGLTIPPALDGKDLIGLAETGSGKTLAFGLPIIERLVPGQQALILAPTRELAEQICETLAGLQVRCVLVVGGKSMNVQIQQLRRGPQVIVATPGRLKDLLYQGAAKLGRISILVLDEADRMLDMGFMPDIRRIIAATPKERQTLLFSATLPKEIEELAAEFLTNPVRLEADRSGSTPKLVDQELLYVEFADKHAILGEMLHTYRGPVIVFVRTRHGARKLAKHIKMEGHKSAEIHSDRTQAQRREALEGFKAGYYRVLVATDIAARGIDVKDIELVLNYDVPEQPEDYVHRIGRTGRAGASGKAITLALHNQRHLIKEIEKILGTTIPTSRRVGALAHATPAPAAKPAPAEPKMPEPATTPRPQVLFQPTNLKPGAKKRRHPAKPTPYQQHAEEKKHHSRPDAPKFNQQEVKKVKPHRGSTNEPAQPETTKKREVPAFAKAVAKRPKTRAGAGGKKPTGFVPWAQRRKRK